MLLPHLIPHLDREIARLQKARDLLATESNPNENYLVTVPRPQPRLPSSMPGQGLAERIDLEAAAAAATETSASGNPAPNSTGALPPITYLKGRRRVERRSEPRLQKRKQLASIDSALSGAVPTGPIVISAEQVRKSQAAKTAQSELAAEVKKADSDFASVLSWRGRAEEKNSDDFMLQKLMQMGKSQEGDRQTDPFSSLGDRGRFGSGRSPLTPESD